jgi:membrane protein DedA with SNARE-associated domain
MDARELVSQLGPFAAFVVATFDRSGLPLITGSVCVAVGAAGGSLVATVALGTLGMIVGDLALFEIGRAGGPRSRVVGRILRPLRPLRATARAILKRYPYLSLAFGRYVAGAGILLPMLAGSAAMKRGRVYPILVVASIAYVVPWGTAAFYLGQSFVSVLEELGTRLAWLALAGLIAVAAGFAYFRIRRRARRAAAAARETAEREAARSPESSRR